MKLWIIVTFASILTLAILVGDSSAKPFVTGNNAETRCQSFGRRRRWVDTNNRGGNGSSFHYVFNPNTEQCMKVLGPLSGYSAGFETWSECESACKNVFHGRLGR